MASILSDLAEEIEKIPSYTVFGRVTAGLGMMVEIGGVERALAIGDRVHLNNKRGGKVTCEIVGFKDGRALAMPFSGLDGIGVGSEAEIENADYRVYPTDSWLGRVINAMGQPIDEKGVLLGGTKGYPVRGTPPPAHTRSRIGP